MKKIIVLTLLCVTFSGLNAQNTFPTSGNVGIGTINPTNPLTVYAANNFLLLDRPNNTTFMGLSYSTANVVKWFTGLREMGTDRYSIWNGTYALERFSILENGNVGIGTTTPRAILSINNSTPIIQLFDTELNPADGSSMGKLEFGSSQSFASIEALRYGNFLDDVTCMVFRTSFATGAGGDGPNMERMRINPNGYVGIGTSSPDARLAVNGTIHTKEVRVDLTDFPDYVFQPNYQLKPLSEVKTYIDQNHHLPEMPSAVEVEKDGLNLGEMNKLLTKKVEELTLYLIAKDKLDKEKDERIKKLEQQMEKLTKSTKN